MANNSHKNGTRRTLNRREVIQYGGGAVVAAAASTLPAPAVHAATPIKIGFVSPQTGPLAPFGEADRFVLANAREVLKGGIKIGGKMHPVEILSRDSQSSPTRAAEVAQELILKHEVVLMMASSTGDTVNPVSDQCEANEVPCITSDAPWQVAFFGRGGKPKTGFTWTYHFFWGFEDMFAVFTNMWNQIPNNKKVGSLIENSADGVAAGDPKRGFRPPIEGAGFKYLQPSLFSPGASDFTAQISQFKKEGVEILTGVAVPPDFTTYWTQVAQQGLAKQIKIATMAKALLFPAALEALGDRGTGLTTEVWWSPNHPFKSGLNGMTSGEFAAAFTKATGKQWTQPLGFKHATIEIAIDVLKRCGNPKDPKAILKALTETDHNTIVGPISWKGGKNNPVKNACKTPLVGGQWKKGKKHKYDLVIVNNKTAPNIPTGGPLDPLKL